MDLPFLFSLYFVNFFCKNRLHYKPSTMVMDDTMVLISNEVGWFKNKTSLHPNTPTNSFSSHILPDPTEFEWMLH